MARCSIAVACGIVDLLEVRPAVGAGEHRQAHRAEAERRGLEVELAEGAVLHRGMVLRSRARPAREPAGGGSPGAAPGSRYTRASMSVKQHPEIVVQARRGGTRRERAPRGGRTGRARRRDRRALGRPRHGHVLALLGQAVPGTGLARRRHRRALRLGRRAARHHERLARRPRLPGRPRARHARRPRPVRGRPALRPQAQGTAQLLRQPRRLPRGQRASRLGRPHVSAARPPRPAERRCRCSRPASASTRGRSPPASTAAACVCYATPVTVAAATFALMPELLPEISAAMRAHPVLVEGPAWFDTIVMETLPGVDQQERRRGPRLRLAARWPRILREGRRRRRQGRGPRGRHGSHGRARPRRRRRAAARRAGGRSSTTPETSSASCWPSPRPDTDRIRPKPRPAPEGRQRRDTRERGPAPFPPHPRCGTLCPAPQGAVDDHTLPGAAHDTQDGPAEGESRGGDHRPDAPRRVPHHRGAAFVLPGHRRPRDRVHAAARPGDGALRGGRRPRLRPHGLRLGRRERGHGAHGVRPRVRQAELRQGALGAGRARRLRISRRWPTSRARSWPPSSSASPGAGWRSAA